MFFKRLVKERNPEPIKPTDPALDETVRYIEWLMAWYCRRPSFVLANIIVEKLQFLRVRVQQGELLDPEWSCIRLVQNWEQIAERSRNRAMR
ncbi:MAG: hypothetical protein AAF353_18205 [Pseudomonadota bacterium]